MSTNMPSWQDQKLGTMKRGALWLVQVVGVGEVFTKTQLREAFPETAQIDRRMRDLRDFGWRIDTNREDDGLLAHEQRFVEQGTAVWEPGQGTRPASTFTDTQRRALLVRDGHKCRSCGIGPGEKYVGTFVNSQLDIARREVLLPSGETEVQPLIECKRCRVGGRGLSADLGQVLSRIDQLPAIERKMLAAWIAQDARGFSEVEELWASYRTLPADSRDQVRDALQ